MTPAGYARLQEELQRLVRVERPAVTAAIEEARAHGDLKENAEYHAAREKQGMMEARIRVIEAKLAMSQVIDPATLKGTRVVFGATVELEDVDQGTSKTWTIVGDEESSVEHGLLNCMAPLARAIIGREEGDDVEIPTENGVRTYSILSVSFGPVSLPPQPA